MNALRWHLLLRRAAVLCLLMAIAGRALGQPADGTILGQDDRNGDGTPDVTIVAATLFGSGDVIRVYDGDGDMQSGEDWRLVTDQDSDFWVFDVANDGSPQLAIQFSRSGVQYRADVYADINRDGNVDLDLSSAQPRVVESGVVHPVLTAYADGGWTLPDGQLNWNVRFTTDGSLIFDTDQLPQGIETLAFIRNFWLPFLIYDGQPDMEFSFHDADRDGVPEYLLWRLFSQTPFDSAALRARLWSNVGQSRPIQPDPSLFWPLLVGSGQEIFGGSNYFDTPPFVGMDWAAARLTPPQFHGYPIEEGFHVHNLSYWELGEVNYANFEIAQAYYDIAEDDDTRPELHIRHRYYGPDDPMAWNVPTAISEIRYSWNQFNSPDLHWDFGLGLANRTPVDDQIDFPDFSYHAIPYEELPEWVLNSSWDISTMIAPEGQRYLSTEGIYEWGPVETFGQLVEGTGDASTFTEDDQNSLMSRFLAGQEVQIDLARTFDEDLAIGLRGEVRYSSSGSPLVYYSGIDHRIHLLHADHGVWNMGEKTRLDYANTDGDAFLDQWSLVEGDRIVARLIQARDYLLLADDSGVTVRQAAAPEALFIVRPPATHAEWSAFGEQIGAHQATLANGALQAMFAQYAGQTWTYPDAMLEHVRLTPGGAHFIMQARASNSDALVSVYVILDGGPPLVIPRQTPAITAQFDATWLEEAALARHIPNRVSAVLTNPDAQDSPELEVQLLAAQTGREPAIVGATQLRLAVGETRRLWFDWTPPEAGDWVLKVAAIPVTFGQTGVTASPKVLGPVLAQHPVYVAAPAGPTTYELITLRDEQPFGGALVVVLAACLVISLFILALLGLRRQTPDER